MSKYFEGLNYSLANEDTWVEYELAPDKAKSIFTVCGSGSRATPLLAKNPQELHVVDLSETQLKLFRLRVRAAKVLSYENYLYFLGYTHFTKNHLNRSILIRELNLTEEDLVFWKRLEKIWSDKGFVYLGKWERHFMKLGRLFRVVSLGHMDPIFAARDLEEQHFALEKYWKPAFFKRYTQVVMNEWVANKLLYKGSFAGSKAKNTMKISAAEFIYQEFSDLFQTTHVRKNYFLQMIFLNQVRYPEAFPTECDPEIFEKIKGSETQIYTHQKNLLELLKESPHSFYSLSDTFSYMSDLEVANFLSELPQGIYPSTQMVIRTFMRKPSFEISSPWMSDKDYNKDMAKRDCTRMYEFTLLTKLSL